MSKLDQLLDHLEELGYIKEPKVSKREPKTPKAPKAPKEPRVLKGKPSTKKSLIDCIETEGYLRVPQYYIPSMNETGNFLEVDADMFSFPPDYYLVHQCNCTGQRSSGLAKEIFEKYPAANIYSSKNAYCDNRNPGEVKIIGRIINILGQINPGKGRSHGDDSYAARTQYFATALRNIEKSNIPAGSTLVFPGGIGCGMAGGDWKINRNLIRNFADDNQQLKVIIASN